MIRIGITGGIGSGKSVVSELFRLSGIPVFIADDESKQLLDSSMTIRESLTSLFGRDIYFDGFLDRRLLASKIFGNEELLKKVNGIVHPVVRQKFFDWVDCQKQVSEYCGIESAILYEAHFENTVDCVLMVYAPIELRIKRTVVRDKTSSESVARRIVSQMSDEEKRARADYVIMNDDVHSLISQTNNFLSFLHSFNP